MNELNKKISEIDLEKEKHIEYGYFKKERNVKVLLVNYNNLKMSLIKKIILDPKKEEIKTEKQIMDLNHINIVKYYKLYEFPKKIVIYMEYLNKGTLKNIIEKIHFKENQKKYDRPTLIKISGILALEILKGLKYLKEKKIVHRDIKPSNICLSNDGKIKITDFGISKKIEKTYESLHTLAGTQLYLAPEMLFDESYKGNKTDIWALGILIYIFVFGEHPFLDKFLNLNFSSHEEHYFKLRQKDFKLDLQGDVFFTKFLQGMLEFNPRNRMDLDQLLKSNFLKKRIIGKKGLKSEFKEFLDNFPKQKTIL